VWGNTHSTYLQPLNILHNKFLRTLLFLPKRTPVTSLYQQAACLPLNYLYKFQVAILIYKFLNLPHTVPPAFLNFFQITAHVHDHLTRAAVSQELYHHQTSINLRLIHLSISGPQIWSTVPLHIKTVPSISLFKNQLHSHFLTLIS